MNALTCHVSKYFQFNSFLTSLIELSGNAPLVQTRLLCIQTFLASAQSFGHQNNTVPKDVHI